MKITNFLTALSFSILLLMSSLASARPSENRMSQITLEGFAETEVTPDILYLEIDLQEYATPKGKAKVEATADKLRTKISELGIPDEDFTLINASSYAPWEKDRDPTFVAHRQYRIKLKDLSNLDSIMKAVDSKAVGSTNLNNYDYSKKAALAKELEIKALLDAKEKAQYMVATLGQKLGKVIEISELDNFGQPMMMAMGVAMDSRAAPAVNFQKIKMSKKVRVIFEIKE